MDESDFGTVSGYNGDSLAGDELDRDLLEGAESASEEQPSEVARESRKHSDLIEERDRLKEYWHAAHKKYSEDYRFSNGEQYENQDGESGGDHDIYVREVYNVVDGLITPIINGIRKAPPAIGIYPAAEGADDEEATDLAGAIRAIEYDTHATASYCYALDCAARGGIGVWRTTVAKHAKMEIETEPIIDPTTVYPDDKAIKPSFMDAKVVHHCVPFPISRFKRDFPDAALPAKAPGDETSEYTPDTSTSGDGGMINIWECWELVWDESQGCDVLDHYVYTEYEVLRSELGLPLHILPYHFVVGKRAFVDGHVVFYGLTNSMRSSQKGVNFFLSEAANHLATHPKSKIYGDAGALTSEQEARWAASAYDPDYFLEKQPGKEVAFIPLPEPPTAFVEIADKFSDIMRICSAIYADSSVQEGLIKQSGEALKQQIAQANLGAYHIVDSLKCALHHCGECYLDIISAYWNDDGIHVGRSVDGRTSFISIGPSQIPSVKNVNAAYGRFGVTISSGPSYDSQFEAMMDQVQDLVSKGGEFSAPLLVFWLQNIPIPGAESMAQIIRAGLSPQMQAVLDAQSAKDGLTPSERIPQLVSQLQTAQQQVVHLSQLVQQSTQTVQALSAKAQEAEAKTASEMQMAREKNEATLQNAREDRSLQLQVEELKAQVQLIRESLITERDKALETQKDNRDITLAEMNAGVDPSTSVFQTATR